MKRAILTAAILVGFVPISLLAHYSLTSPPPFKVTVTPTQSHYTNVAEVEFWLRVENVSTNAQVLEIPDQGSSSQFSFAWPQIVQFTHNDTYLAPWFDDDMGFLSRTIAPGGIDSHLLHIFDFHSNSLTAGNVGTGSYQIIWLADSASGWVNWSQGYTSTFEVVTEIAATTDVSDETQNRKSAKPSPPLLKVTVTPTQSYCTNVNDAEFWLVIENMTTNSLPLGVPPPHVSGVWWPQYLQVVHDGKPLSNLGYNVDIWWPIEQIPSGGIVSNLLPVAYFYVNPPVADTGSYQIIWRSDWAGGDFQASGNVTSTFEVITEITQSDKVSADSQTRNSTKTAPSWKVTVTPTQSYYTNVYEAEFVFEAENISTSSLSIMLPHDEFSGPWPQFIQVTHDGTNLARWQREDSYFFPARPIAPGGVVSNLLPLVEFYTNQLGVGTGVYQIIWRGDRASGFLRFSENYTGSFEVVEDDTKNADADNDAVLDPRSFDRTEEFNKIYEFIQIYKGSNSFQLLSEPIIKKPITMEEVIELLGEPTSKDEDSLMYDVLFYRKGPHWRTTIICLSFKDNLLAGYYTLEDYGMIE